MTMQHQAMTTTDTQNNDTPDLDISVAIAEPRLVGNTPALSDTELRSEPRFRVKWHATVLLRGNAAYHGIVKDISIKGAAILLERNLQEVKLVTLHLHVPPFDAIGVARIVKMEGKLIYSVHDHDELFFRAGFHFIKFKSESDLNHLRSRLTNLHVEIKY